MAGSGTQQGFDLHTHSVFSDGTTRPSDIAREAAGIGLAGFALTDHDTIDGWGEARDAARDAGVDFLPGIEITTKHAGRSRHLLGYGIDPAAGELFAALAEVRSSRLGRAQEMVRRLSAAYAITWESVVGEEDARTVGRPHIADALVAAGYFADRSTAFAEILHPGSPYYLGTYAIETVEAIRLVRAAGGAAALAHPAAFRQRTPTTARELRELAAAGLWGVELDHPENRADWLPPLAEAAAELGLAVTGSSDYHGVGKPNLLGERATDPALVERLRERLVTPR
ncbi:PHP domain-containing protein [Leucobacter muris]|jgi:predicted metal-dependent phosphoesterase TrpH|uniref:PHP domain-containing protein n=1 Tax=Leucobacter muris TaxID=1935379 RepID=A0ABX5QEQ7_9MICO|nr:PHP domain-containing protein [Leucobacter muris]QAB17567.1 PHP domain-containing protein [Leucobacter muris]